MPVRTASRPSGQGRLNHVTEKGSANGFPSGTPVQILIVRKHADDRFLLCSNHFCRCTPVTSGGLSVGTAAR